MLYNALLGFGMHGLINKWIQTQYLLKRELIVKKGEKMIREQKICTRQIAALESWYGPNYSFYSVLFHNTMKRGIISDLLGYLRKREDGCVNGCVKRFPNNVSWAGPDCTGALSFGGTLNHAQLPESRRGWYKILPSILRNHTITVLVGDMQSQS